MDTHCWQFDDHGEPGEVLHWRAETLPEPGPGQALIKIRTVGLNRSELRYVTGNYVPPRAFPTGVGHEAVGEVLALGEPDPEAPPLPQLQLKVGARVALMPGRIDMVTMGSYREHGIYAQNALLPVPEPLSDAEAAGFWMGALTMGGAFAAAGLSEDNASGKRVLVTAAASGMGVVGLKMARAWGAETIAVTRTPHKQAALRELADHALVCTESAKLGDILHSATKGAGFDVAVDPVGAEYVSGLVHAAAPLGQIVHYEMITGRQSQLPLPPLLVKDIGVHGFTLFRLFRQPGLLERMVDNALALGERIRPVVADTFPMSEAPGALSAMSHGAHLGKLVLTTA